MKRNIAYFKYVCSHKYFVFMACMRVGGVPVWRALIHDWTKFLPVEWGGYARNFFNDDGSRRKKPEKWWNDGNKQIEEEFIKAWYHHESHNPHYWGYWTVFYGGEGACAVEMPDTYIMEMVADWIGAGMAISGHGNPKEWYEANQDKIILHPDTREKVENVIESLQQDFRY